MNTKHSESFTDITDSDSFLENDIKDFVSKCTKFVDLCKFYETNTNSKLSGTFRLLQETLDEEMISVGINLLKYAPQYDFYTKEHRIRANGFRSLIYILSQCIEVLHYEIIPNATNFSFRYSLKRKKKQKILKEYSICLQELCKCLRIAEDIHACKGSVNPRCSFRKSHKRKLRFIGLTEKEEKLKHLPLICTVSEKCEVTHRRIREDVMNINRTVFYGHCFGYYFIPSIQKVMNLLCSSFAACQKSIEKNNNISFLKTLFFVLKYQRNPLERAKNFLNYSDDISVDNLRTIWQMTESKLIKFLFRRHSQSLTINCKYSIPLEKSDEIVFSIYDANHKIPAHTLETAKPYIRVNSQLLSMKRIRLRIYSSSNAPKFFDTGDFPYIVSESISPYTRNSTDEEKPTRLIIHIHGGGFISQSPDAHLPYLSDWTSDFECPIISIDYHHAPEYPFPNAVEECFYAYCWIVKNGLSQLGCNKNTKILLIGDSSGANIALGVMQKLISLGLHYLPTPCGLGLFYPVVNLSLHISPSRILSLTDAFLPLGVTTRLLQAYTGDESISSDKNVDEKFLNDSLFCPINMKNTIAREFPPIKIIVGDMDPLLDDSIDLAKFFFSSNVPIELKVFKGLPHGFLNFLFFDENFQDANRESINVLSKLFAKRTICGEFR